MKRLHEVANMTYEEEYGDCFKLKTSLTEEVKNYNNQTLFRNKSQNLVKEEAKIDSQLSLSNPLLT